MPVIYDDKRVQHFLFSLLLLRTKCEAFRNFNFYKNRLVNIGAAGGTIARTDVLILLFLIHSPLSRQ